MSVSSAYRRYCSSASRRRRRGGERERDARLHLLGDRLPPDLDGDPALAVAPWSSVDGLEARAVHLGDRGRGERGAVDVVERVLGVDAELAPEDADDLGPGDVGRRVEDAAEGVAVGLGEDGGLDGERLAQLDVQALVDVDEVAEAAGGALVEGVDLVGLARVEVELEVEGEGDAEERGAQAARDGVGVELLVPREDACDAEADCAGCAQPTRSL